jgi:hypothetical protein
MDKGLYIKFLWSDPDVAEIGVSAWNGEFSGVARAYVGLDDLTGAALKLNGFPKNSDDRCELTLGTFDPKFAGGGMALHFFCKDLAGHIVVEVRIQSEPFPDSNRWSSPPETVRLFAAVEAHAIDEFVKQLTNFKLNVESSAFLSFTHF